MVEMDSVRQPILDDGVDSGLRGCLCFLPVAYEMKMAKIKWEERDYVMGESKSMSNGEPNFGSPVGAYHCHINHLSNFLSHKPHPFQ